MKREMACPLKGKQIFPCVMMPWNLELGTYLRTSVQVPLEVFKQLLELTLSGNINLLPISWRCLWKYVWHQ